MTIDPPVLGQARACPLGHTLERALHAAPAAGVTRLADLSGLDPIGLPVFQAVRPRGRCLSVSMGKGVTRRAAMVSALIEAIETDLAERVVANGPPIALAALGAPALRLWSGGARDPRGIRLDLDRPREWIDGFEIGSGAACALPLDLVSLDFTRPAAPDVLRSTVGLASGNTRAEALVGAVGELIEHDLLTGWRHASPVEQRDMEVNLAGIDNPLVNATLARIGAAGRRVRLWGIGQGTGVAAFHCIISDDPASDTALHPVGGSACHPDRTVAALGAILEAAQSRAAVIAGAREDLTPDDYGDGPGRTIALLLATLGFGTAPLAWSTVPTCAGATPEANLATLLRVAAARSQLPVVAVALGQPDPDIHVVKALAPGLRQTERRSSAAARLRARAAARPRRDPRRILFAGPTLAGAVIPPNIALRSPAVAGDLAALLDDPPEMVGLVDGCFELAPAVWHKEILDLLAHGVTVLGAASLGALRAAELHALGMTGIGAVFRAYRDGAVSRDDAVMVAHAPAALGHRPLTLALVDAEDAIATIDLAPADRRMLQRIARTLPFRTRDWPAILTAFRERTGRAAPIDAGRLAAIPSRKREDALELLAVLAGPRVVPAQAPRPPLTEFYRGLLAVA